MYSCIYFQLLSWFIITAITLNVCYLSNHHLILLLVVKLIIVGITTFCSVYRNLLLLLVTWCIIVIMLVLQAPVRRLPFKRHSSYSRLQDDPRILNARKTVQGACSRYDLASTEHKVSLINVDEVYTRCAEEFAQNTIDDIEKHTLECRSAEAWKAINLFCGRKFRFTNCANA